MNKLIIGSLMFISACGSESYQTMYGPKGDSCIVEDVPKGDAALPLGGSKITCGDKVSLVSNGQGGASCSVVSVAEGDAVLPLGGALITCGESVVLVSNGKKGEDGSPGQDYIPTGFEVVESIDPCGDAPNVVDEIVLKLGNGKLIASFSDNVEGKNTRLSYLYDGSFQTTDGSNCRFNVINGVLY